MKTIKKIAAILLSITMVAVPSVFPAEAYSSKAETQEIAPTPLTSLTLKAFKKTTPKISLSDNSGNDYYYYSYYTKAITWQPINHAMIYYIYQKNEKGKFAQVATTFDTSYYPNNEGVYAIRAVSFDFSDKIAYSRYSNEVTVDYPDYYLDNDYYEEEAVEEEKVADDEGYTTASASINAVASISPMPTASYDYNTEEYTSSNESGYKSVVNNPLSTFSADVYTASYANLRRLINDGSAIPEDAVRIEEMLNYFDYSSYKEPTGNKPFSINTELSDCPWNKNSKLLMVGINGKDIPQAEIPASNLVFLVDTSGSMYSSDKLELVKKCFNILTKQLTSKDRISIVTYSGFEKVILQGAKGNQIKTVSTLTKNLVADGCTNGESGIQTAYAIAQKYYIKGGNNRIILATDGDLNVGISDPDELKALVEEKRQSGINLSVLGFGTGNIKDDNMEVLADNGNGSYHYIDSPTEAWKVLSEERTSTLFTIAKDVKLQVEFNSQYVKGYRLIGYDNRRLENDDFTDDTKDAGDIGAGCTVTALYEIVPADSKTNINSSDLKYQTSSGVSNGEWLTVNVRYKDPDGTTSQLISKTVNGKSYSSEMSSDMKFACAVTEFGLILKNSDYKGTSSIDSVKNLLKSSKVSADSYKKEFSTLVELYDVNNA